MHLHMKTTQFDRRNPKIAPLRSHSYQKGHLCIPKTKAIQRTIKGHSGKKS